MNKVDIYTREPRFLTAYNMYMRMGTRAFTQVVVLFEIRRKYVNRRVHAGARRVLMSFVS